VTDSAAPRRLAVLGSPIDHSKSPALHRAAYGVLDLGWEYDAVELRGAGLPDFIRSRDTSWRGLSLTMPLKRDVLPLLTSIHPLAEHTGSANTVLFEDSAERGIRGFNTDVYGIAEAFRRHGHSHLGNVHILGGGATAASAIAAAAELGAGQVTVFTRTPANAAPLADVARKSAVRLEIRELSAISAAPDLPDAVISTLPNGADARLDIPESLRASAILFDVAYHPWPSPLAQKWSAPVISGLEMLVLQALVQVRIFVGTDPETQLDREDAVLAAMRAAVGL
jgi:shikimate dehydrogenase